MAKERRVLRLQQVILEEVARAIQSDLDDPRIGMVTVTRVQLSPDLSTATVLWSTLATEGERRTTARGLENALPLLQRRVAKVMGTRITPTLSLRFDASMERAQRLDDIFRHLRDEKGEPTSDAEPSEPAPSDPEPSDPKDATPADDEDA